MKINIELELHPYTEHPNTPYESNSVLVLCQRRNFFGQLYYYDTDQGANGWVGKGELGLHIPWYEIDGWISVSELKEQVMKASGK